MATTQASQGHHEQQAIARTVAGLNYELVDVQRTAGGLLRVFIDRMPSLDTVDLQWPSVTVEDCERVTRQLQYVLQVEGVDYQRLEVSSPGLDRPLKQPADYERFAGELVNITLKLPFKGRKNYRGVLARAGGAWRLELDSDPQQTLDFQLDEVREARLVPVVNFKGRGAKPGASGPGQGHAGKERDGGHAR